MAALPVPEDARPRDESVAAHRMALLFADARLPTGGHTQSGGLEPALSAGMDPAAVPDYIAARLVTVVKTDAAAAVIARHLVSRPARDRRGMVADLDRTWRAWSARTASQVLRGAAGMVGRGYQRVLGHLWPTAPAVLALREATDLHRSRARRSGVSSPAAVAAPRPLAMGVAAALAGMSPRQAALGVGYDDVQSVAAAMLKLHPVDPMATTAWVVEAGDALEAMVHAVEHLTDPRDLPARSAPQIDQWADAHARRPERLFSA